MNAVRLRKLLGRSTARTSRQIRSMSIAASGRRRSATLEIPHIDLETELGGYDKVRSGSGSRFSTSRFSGKASRARRRCSGSRSPSRGMIFCPAPARRCSPRQTASSRHHDRVGARAKSKWVGERGEPSPDIPSGPASRARRYRLRRARLVRRRPRHVPRAWRRAPDGESALTEMDGFHREEMVFIVGTIQFRRDPRPGSPASGPIRVPPAPFPILTRPIAGRSFDLRSQDGPRDDAGSCFDTRPSDRRFRRGRPSAPASGDHLTLCRASPASGSARTGSDRRAGRHRPPSPSGSNARR